MTALQLRHDSLSSHRNICAGTSFTLLALAVVFAWLVTRSLTQPLSRAVEVFGLAKASSVRRHIGDVR